MSHAMPTEPTSDRAALQAALDAERVRLAELTVQHERLRKAYRELQLELELLRRRIFVATAERIDSSSLQLEFFSKLAELDKLAGIVPSGAQGPAPDETKTAPADKPESDTGGDKPKPPRKPPGRRNVRELEIPEERVELVDPDLEGKAPRIGFEESAKLAWRRGTYVCS
jgi:hypothetical protein